MSSDVGFRQALGRRVAEPGVPVEQSASEHSLTDRLSNDRLWLYERSVKQAFDDIVPVLKQVASERCEPDFA